MENIQRLPLCDLLKKVKQGDLIYTTYLQVTNGPDYKSVMWQGSNTPCGWGMWFKKMGKFTKKRNFLHCAQYRGCLLNNQESCWACLFFQLFYLVKIEFPCSSERPAGSLFLSTVCLALMPGADYRCPFPNKACQVGLQAQLYLWKATL